MLCHSSTFSRRFFAKLVEDWRTGFPEPGKTLIHTASYRLYTKFVKEANKDCLMPITFANVSPSSSFIS
jgi:hypothetical protein